jgi:DNA-binding SARP family transcriptional activator
VDGLAQSDDGPAFRVLGPVGVQVGDQVQPPGGPGLAALLAILLLEPNQVVPFDRIVDQLWEFEPPATARTIVQGYVSRTRKWLSRVDSSGSTRIETTRAGYQLVIDESRIDAEIARRLLSQARDQPPEVRSALLTEAQALWRGPELSDIGGRVRAPELAELRLAVIEARIDADLELARHEDVVAELAALVATHPFREHLVGQLVLALYRSGRRAAALEMYQQFAHRAAGELGLDPGPGLRELHSRILRDDTGLLRSRPMAALRTGVVTPAQLPAPPSGFAGRESELVWLDGVRGEGVAVIAGPAGIGKSALALCWGSQVAREFGHGQLYASLRGFDPRHEPLDAADVLARFLLALGVAAEGIPADPADRAALYRSLLADRKVLVVLDDARDSDQVRPLLPGVGRSLVLVTSRRRLDGLVADGARLRVVHTLAPNAAVRLVQHAAGAVVDRADHANWARLARLCGYLPLALRIAGARLAVSPQWSVADLVAELSDERNRLAALDVEDDDTSVRAALDVTYRRLDEAHADTLRALGAFPGLWVSPHTVAALCGVDLVQARARLRVLAGSFLVTELDRDVYGMHDLVRLFARELAGAATEPLAAVLRYYLAVADLCRRHLRPVDDDLAPTSEAPVPEITDRDAALDWFEREWPNLLAVASAGAEAGLHASVWPLARIATDFRRVRSRRDDWEQLLDLGLTSARAVNDRRGEVLVRLCRCVLLTRFGAEHETVTDAEAAVALADSVGDAKLTAMAHNTLASAWFGLKQYPEALAGYLRALDLARRAGYRVGEANLHNNIAQVYLNLGQPADAVEPQRLAISLYREVGDLGFVGLALANLAELEHELGSFAAAEANAREAVSLAEVNGLALAEAFGREVLSRVLRDTGNIPGARTELTLAIDRYRAAQSPAADSARAALASLPPTP